jgi:hypothetical protein
MERQFRTRFQFRLRTLLLTVTIVAVPCAYFGYQASVVRDRKAWLAAHRDFAMQRGTTADRQSTSVGIPIIMRSGSHFDLVDNSVSFVKITAGDPMRSPNVIRRWLGDEPQQSISVRPWTSSSEIEEIVSLFPEAVIVAEDRESGRRGTGTENADVTKPTTAP